MQLEIGFLLGIHKCVSETLTLKLQAQSWAVHADHAVDRDWDFKVSVHLFRQHLPNAWSMHKSPSFMMWVTTQLTAQLYNHHFTAQ